MKQQVCDHPHGGGGGGWEGIVEEVLTYVVKEFKLTAPITSQPSYVPSNS